MRRLSVIAFLLLTVPAAGQSFGQFTISDSAAEKREAALIRVSHDIVEPGQEFKVRIKNDLPYEIKGRTRFVAKWPQPDENGDRVVEITTDKENPEDITIVINHEVTHPTKDELDAAPLFKNKEDWKEWNDKFNKDEHYRDSRTVFVTGSGSHNKAAVTDDDLTDFSQGVKELAESVDGDPFRAASASVLADNYAKVVSDIDEGLYKRKVIEDVTDLNGPLIEDSAGWQKFFARLEKAIEHRDEKEEIKTVEDVKKLFQEIQAGLAAAAGG